MPIAKFQLPDGRVARFEVPEGTTPEQAQAQIGQMISSGQLEQQQPVDQPPVSPQQPPPRGGAIPADKPKPASPRMRRGQEIRQRQNAEYEALLGTMSPERRELLESISPGEAMLISAGRGLTNIARGVGLADQEDEFGRKTMQELETKYPTETTVGEVAAEAAPFLIPGMGVGKIASKVGRVAATAGLGATEAGIITRGKGGDLGDQLMSAGIGGTVAGALELGLPVIGRLGGRIIRRVLGKAPKGAVIDATGKPSQELVEALAENGQSFDDLIDVAKKELKRKVVDPRQASRKAFLKSQGIDPTKAQITRSADDFMAQQEAAKTSTAVRAALEEQDAVLTTRFNNKVLETGGVTRGSSVSDFIIDKATELDDEISGLYKAVRKNMPKDKNIRFKNLLNRLHQLRGADRRAGGNVSAVISDLKAKGILDKKGKLVGTTDTKIAEEIRIGMNSLYDAKNPYGNMILRQLKDELDDDVFSAAGADYFKQARDAKRAFEQELSRAKVSRFDSRNANLVRDILENRLDPDRVSEQVVFGKRWRPEDLEQLKNYVSTSDVGKEAFDDLRAQVMQDIKEMSFIGAEDASGYQALSRDKLEKAINKIGAKKLAILFNTEERKFLKDMLQVAEMREPVRGTAMGRGPSAQAISRVEALLGKIPILGDMAVDKVQGRIVLKAKPMALPKPTSAAKVIPPNTAAALSGSAVAADQLNTEQEY